MKLIVGLGNPGAQYAQTRHNVGWACLEYVRETAQGSAWRDERKKFSAETATVTLGGEKCLLVKPQTFMNRSGEAVTRLRQFYKLGAEDVWVVYDDVSLPVGSWRYRAQGSAGGHNGVKSLIAHLGTREWPRLKIGVDTPKRQQYGDLADYVLGRVSPAEQAALETVYPAVCTELRERLGA